MPYSMLVKRIVEFIDKVNTISELPDFDRLFLDQLQAKFSILPIDQALSNDDIESLKQLFCQRWNLIFEKSHDYTLNPTQGANPCWIWLANRLAIETKLNPLQILIPLPNLNHQIIGSAEDDLGLNLVFLNDDCTYFINVPSLFEGYENATPFHQAAPGKNKLERKRATSADMLLAMSNDHKRHITDLSLSELSRVKVKADNFNFNRNARNVKLWDYIEHTIKSVGLKGSLPKHLLPPLIALIEMYFADPIQSSPTFSAQFLVWTKLLGSCSIEDRYCLYAQRIQIDNKSILLVNFLLDCLHVQHKSIKNKLVAIGRWLYEVDASFIINQNEFCDLHTELNAGRKFQITHLKTMLNDLTQDCSATISEKITFLSATLDGRVTIDAVILEQLASIYRQRWDEIKETESDYRRLTSGANLHWIRLAQLLARYHLDVNYFSLLMPSVAPLSLADLALVKQKKGDLYFEFLGATYENFSHELACNFVSNWQVFSELPRHLLPKLLELVDVYFELSSQSKSLSSFRQQLAFWTTDLLECSFDDVNFLYMQPIIVGKRKTYLAHVILDCLDENKTNLECEIMGIARWLNDYDASFVAQRAELNIVYAELQVGPAFSVAHLKSMLAKLTLNCSSKMLKRIDNLLNLIQDKQHIDSQVIELLLILYQQRWSEIEGTENDYTRQQSGVNAEWIHLAQLVSGAKLIQTDYYHLLMPTLDSDITIDSVTLEPLVNYPLSHYILSETSLILLDNSADKYIMMKKNEHFHNKNLADTGVFYNCNRIPCSSFNEQQHDSLRYANKKFHKYIELTRYLNKNNNPISLETVNALTKLVNESLFPQGLAALVDVYTTEQIDSVHNAYLNFYHFYRHMPEDERIRLNQHVIYFDRQYKTFQKVFDDFNNEGQHACAATTAQWFLQLIIDYLPNRRFSQAIENGVLVDVILSSQLVTVDIERMRSSSQKKLLNDALEFKERAQHLCVAIMTHSFSFESLWVQRHSISLLDCTNNVDEVTKNIFDQLIAMLDEDDFTRYPDLIYFITSLNQHALKNNYSEKTVCWLQSLVAPFKHTAQLYEPERILKILFSMIQVKSQPVLQSFLDSTMQMYAQESLDFGMNKIIVNIKFRELIPSIASDVYRQIVQFLEEDNNQSSDVGLRTMSIKYLVYRLSSLGMTGSKSRQPQFLAAPEFNMKSISHELENEHSVSQIVDRLIGVVEVMSANNPLVKTRVVDYLQKIKAPLSTHVTNCTHIRLS